MHHKIKCATDPDTAVSILYKCRLTVDTVGAAVDETERTTETKKPKDTHTHTRNTQPLCSEIFKLEPHPFSRFYC